MKQTLATTACLVIITCAAHAQDRGYWKATSKTAQSITGDIAIAEEKLTMYYSPITIAEIRSLTSSEMTAAFNFEANMSPQGHLYRLSIPAEKKFMHKNTLCGVEETQWMATAVSGKTLQLAFFSGSKMPEMTAEALANNTTLCGTYMYVR